MRGSDGVIVLKRKAPGSSSDGNLRKLLLPVECQLISNGGSPSGIGFQRRHIGWRRCRGLPKVSRIQTPRFTGEVSTRWPKRSANWPAPGPSDARAWEKPPFETPLP